MRRHRPFLYHFFHNETRDRTEKGLVHIPADRELWPESWKKIYYKEYPFFVPIPLPDESGLLLDTLLPKRVSGSGALSNNILSLQKLSYILRAGYGLQDDGKLPGREENRTVPSAGKRYPLELYIMLFKNIPECASGTYHYGIRQHVLEPIAPAGDFPPEKLARFSPQQQEQLRGANGMLCVTAVFDRTTHKYGSRGYRYILIEAGHVAQNVLLAAAEKNLRLLPVGGVEDGEIERELGLTSSKEQLIYVLYF